MRRLSFWLLILLLLCGAARTLRAASAAEDRAFRAADGLFKLELWEFAERDFGDFIQHYPKSPRVPSAILFQAESRYSLGQYPAAISLLSSNLFVAGTNEDRYLYWIAQSHLGSSNYLEAATVFAQLADKFPASSLALPARVGQATAFAKEEDWARVIDVLQKPAAESLPAAASGSGKKAAVEGFLVLGEAQLARGDFTNAEATLSALVPLDLRGEQNWRRSYLQCRIQLAEGRKEEAWQCATNLLLLAGGTNLSLRAETFSFMGGVLEQLSRIKEAAAAYQENLNTNAPAEQQRRALLKVAELSLRQNQTDAAVGKLEDYLKQNPERESSDVALLMLGELQLKQYAIGLGDTNRAGGLGGSSATNLFAEALSKFDRLLVDSPRGPMAGKANLNKGWCFWITTNYVQSEDSFRRAAEILPFSFDQAVARFKWADSQFMLGDFRGALTNYQWVASRYESLAQAKTQLVETALYQTVRVALTNGDLPDATSALQKILDEYPDGFAGPQCLLLVGQELAPRKDPARAREWFMEFEKRYPTNALLSEIRLAAARSYEQEKNWPDAISQYTGWVNVFTNHDKLPQAEFARAWDTYMAGEETNALALFTNFVVRFPTNELAPLAQWWVADYYFRQGDNPNAEIYYQFVFHNTNAPASDLADQARMMAGRTAMARYDYKGAINYFTNLTSNPKSPLYSQGLLAYGDAQMNLESSGTNRAANLVEAIQIFKSIPSTNEFWAAALGKIGDCCLQLAATNAQWYGEASNSYQKVVDLPSSRASFAVRSQAKVGLAIVSERLAERASGERQGLLLREALRHYTDVFNFYKSLRDNELPDLFWVKKAGMEAGRLEEQLGMWGAAYQTYLQLQSSFPSLSSVMEFKLLRIRKAHPEAAREE